MYQEEVVHVLEGRASTLLERASAGLAEKYSRRAAVRLLAAVDAQLAKLEAVRADALAMFGDLCGSERDGAAELALVLAITENQATRELSHARSLRSRLPKVMGLMRAGKVRFYTAGKVCEATSWLSESAVREVDAVLESRLVGKNPLSARRAACYAAAKADPEGLARRTRKRREQRAVHLVHNGAGVADLLLVDAPVERAVAAYTRIDNMAKALKTKDEPRKLDQLRSDVALDLLLTGTGGTPPKAEVYVYLDYLTLAKLNDNPADLAGHGPISASLARDLVATPGAVLRRIITEPATGQPIELGRRRYRPTATVDEFLRIRDRECRHPGCHRPAHFAELDHNKPWSRGGTTDVAQLHGYCKRHHRIKHTPGWKHVAENGDVVITTPGGSRHVSRLVPLHEPRAAAPP
ncbi:HNH endonuclease [Amycolatopsis suaedae]|uniref:HNH endonuclease n=2 Tax=Amycolatopsis suaedae TaxID=2510978 RepID=A0A4Q7J4Q7_9PSEU|nr:HNH endonuclease [Amycolatopsis suaedae]